MGAIATFNYAAWTARYPEFATVSEAAADAYFAEATIYLRNDGSGPVCQASAQLTFLNMLTAHIAALYSDANNPSQPAAINSIVGRISNAAEGSVSVASELASPTPGTMAWFTQTKYGLSFWQGTAAYRTMKYRTRPLVLAGSGPAWVYPRGN